MNSEKYVYLFCEGSAKMKNLLGGKGANLGEMTNLGLPVPEGFTISTDICTEYYKMGGKYSDELIIKLKMESNTLKKLWGQLLVM